MDSDPMPELLDEETFRLQQRALRQAADTEAQGEGFRSAGVKRGAVAAAVHLPLGLGPAQPKVQRETGAAQETITMTTRGAAAACTFGDGPRQLREVVKKPWFELSEQVREKAALFLADRIEGAD